MTSVPPARSPDAGRDPSAGPAADGPPPESATAARDPAASRSRRGAAPAAQPRLALLCGALGAALALVAGGRVWSHATAAFARARCPCRPRAATSPGCPARWPWSASPRSSPSSRCAGPAASLVAALLTLCAAWASPSRPSAPHDSAPLAEKAAKVSGLDRSGIGDVQVTPSGRASRRPAACCCCSPGLLALRYGRGWPSMSGSGRYERPARPQAARGPGAVDPDRPEDIWKALDRGEDPTRGAG